MSRFQPSTRKFRSAKGFLSLVAMTAAAGATLFGTTGVANAAPNCSSSSCLINVETQAGGLSMSATFDTTVLTMDQLWVYRGGALAANPTNTTMRTHHTITTPSNLDANVTYTWHLVVTDASGYSVERTGTLTTLHRQVDVFSQSDAVTNDSDNGGAGEFKTWVMARDKQQQDILASRDLNSGSTVPMMSVLRVRDADLTTRIKTEMYDDDFTCFNPFSCALDAGSVSPNWTNGSSAWGDWATAATNIDTQYATNGLKPFQMQVNANVGFVIRGSYSVTFVA